MNDIEAGLRRLADEGLPPELAHTEEIVFRRIAGHRFGTRVDSLQLRALVIAGALLMGVAGGLLPDNTDARQSLLPLTGPAALAPSTLLTATQ